MLATQAMRNKSFSAGSAVLRRKPQEPPPPGIGAYYNLTYQERASLVEYARVTVAERRAVDRADNAEHAAYRKAKAKTNSQMQLEVRCDVIITSRPVMLAYATPHICCHRR